MVPAEPEYGEITFCEAEEEQLACMFESQTSAPEPFPPELRSSDPSALFPYLISCSFDGLVEITVEGAVNYLVFHDGQVARAYLADSGKGTLVERVARLFDRDSVDLQRLLPVFDSTESGNRATGAGVGAISGGGAKITLWNTTVAFNTSALGCAGNATGAGAHRSGARVS